MSRKHQDHQTEEAAAPMDTEDRIRVRAYEIYLERNSDPGHDLDDWLRAESEVRSAGESREGARA